MFVVSIREDDVFNWWLRALGFKGLRVCNFNW